MKFFERAHLSKQVYRSYVGWLQDHDNKAHGFYDWAMKKYGLTRYCLGSMVKRRGMSKWETNVSDRRSRGRWMWQSHYNLYFDHVDGKPYYSLKAWSTLDKLIVSGIDIDEDFWMCLERKGLDVERLKRMTERRIKSGSEATQLLEG